MSDLPASSQPKPSEQAWRNPDVAFQGTLLLIFIAVFIVLSLIARNFLTVTNLLNIARQAAPTLIVATGMTLVITTGGIDLSVGSGTALVAVLSAMTLGAIGSGFGVVLTVVLMLLLGILLGAVNGYFVAYQRIPAFIVSLASLSIVRGLAQLLTRGYSLPIDPDSPFLWLGRGRIGIVPVPAIIALVVVVVGIILLNTTTLGVYITGIGSNEEAVRRSGVNVRLVKIVVYMISGLVVALGGMVTAARLASGSSYTGVAFELQVIAAVIVGGTNLFGGEGRMLGTVLGTLLLAMIGNGLILLRISPFYQQIIEGLIILLAIWFNLSLSSRWLQGR
ncbi:MAG: ABC transporter permease [Deinococcota bacterium]